MDEHLQGCLMKQVRFRKGKGTPNKPPQSLAQDVIPPFNMSGFTGFFTNRLMSFSQQTKYLFVRFPKITEGGTMSIRSGYPRPQTPAAFFASVANEVRNNLTGSPTESYPDPAFVFFASTNDHSSSNSKTSPDWAWTIGGRAGNESAFSLSHLATVWRATPKVRSMPRKLARS